ncbi:MAG: HAD-IB family hydrolase [Prevotella sp.]|nr:HAD-IB family hydrolase [Candidatus Prevotella equi]
MEKRVIAVFDFDGTLTTKDTMLEFIRFVCGTKKLYLGILLYSPLLVLMKMRVIDNHKLKQRFLSYFFKGLTYSEFSEYGMSFASREAELLNRGTHAMLLKHLQEGADVYVVSASVVEWVRPFCLSLGVKEVLGTEMEVDADGKLTGRFATHNCYGKEKVRRFLEVEPDRDSYTLYAYGDSRGDYPMFELSDYHRKV